MIVVWGAIFAYGNQHKEDGKERQALIQRKHDAQCMLDAECSDQGTKSDSFMSENILRSPTGRYFYKGISCDGDCYWETKGYQWARTNGVTQNQACHVVNLVFESGCLAYVQEQNPPSPNEVMSEYQQ